jgi:hypothetical protein
MTANKKAVVRRLGEPVSILSQMNLQRQSLHNKQNDFSLWICTTAMKKKACET